MPFELRRAARFRPRTLQRKYGRLASSGIQSGRPAYLPSRDRPPAERKSNSLLRSTLGCKRRSDRDMANTLLPSYRGRGASGNASPIRLPSPDDEPCVARMKRWSGFLPLRPECADSQQSPNRYRRALPACQPKPRATFPGTSPRETPCSGCSDLLRGRNSSERDWKGQRTRIPTGREGRRARSHRHSEDCRSCR